MIRPRQLGFCTSFYAGRLRNVSGRLKGGVCASVCFITRLSHIGVKSVPIHSIIIHYALPRID
ncbi:hypothetical protein NEIMUCOT_04433 [Neisseria mucosa ATCC 25996]|uniref:Uncharacterized protein n=1 Tax=Neisseria mucosa (strain ATCC 25996 / DSM 4631 / NCTC 10774 / M26) TaxID=546266 RepID=D2ZUZ2_NEIM2|nr:hypothetical protein NEIMUCOT_04433 [Neisseria mucosa ATCC 25996]